EAWRRAAGADRTADTGDPGDQVYVIEHRRGLGFERVLACQELVVGHGHRPASQLSDESATLGSRRPSSSFQPNWRGRQARDNYLVTASIPAPFGRKQPAAGPTGIHSG